MLLAELVRTSHAVGATRSRLAKRAALAVLFQNLSREEVPVAIGFLTGNMRQRTGVGWSGAWSVDVPPAVDEMLTVADVDICFDRLEAATGTGSQGERAELLRSLFARATEPEQHLLRQLIVGEVHTGALAGVVADAVAHAAGVTTDELRRATMLSGSLAVAATAALFGGSDAVALIGLQVLNPLQPMLASPAGDVSEAVADAAPEVVSVEWKLDGIRVQVHRNGDAVRIFTRNLNDVTVRLPDVVKLVRSLPSTRLILDGELIGLADDDAPHLFQDTAGRFATEQPGQTGQPATYALRPFFFDCMHADGVDLIDERYAVELHIAALPPGELPRVLGRTLKEIRLDFELARMRCVVRVEQRDVPEVRRRPAGVPRRGSTAKSSTKINPPASARSSPPAVAT